MSTDAVSGAVAPAGGLFAAHDGAVRRRCVRLALLTLLLVAGVLADVLTGPSGLSVGDVLAALSGMGDTDAAVEVIVWQVRLPTAILAVLVGASLSLAGAEMQTILRNPLASPFTLGLSSAASFGAALVIVLGVALPYVPDRFAVPAMAFAFAFGTVLVIQLIGNRRSMPPGVLILFGIVMVFGFNALVAVIQFVAPADALQQLVFWTMGSLGRADMWSNLLLGGVLLAVMPFSFRAARALTVLELGRERAESLGVSFARLRFGSLLRASLLAATAVAFSGTIGFVGLVGPHVARLLVGDHHRFLLPAAILCGATVMSFASIAAKLILPGVLLPIGIVTTLVGLPVFLLLLLRQWSR
ncbi:FecCD family ABC transporter permease [Rhodovulum sulfidophilum]|uniref:Iron ABC transporter permease n=1 Tax=Rhodovulum sulfidophilum TaxID=35806 RepID=A0ABS1RVM5_RHOSU|nr:iron ABC transporter permease [Rhodovulum sulfidophilum]MBL3610139.1 iron ABC transporter permease [Rhodovulum sulfidophilum]MCE8456896.1 iron ABC transporter permease [Rhodovulum sulfidophilum]